MQLKVNLYGYVEVIVPYGSAIHTIPDFVDQHHDWITRTIQKLQIRHGKINPDKNRLLPRKIELTAIHKYWDIKYINTHLSNKISLYPAPHCMTVSGDTQNRLLVQKILKKWLTQQGKTHLVPWLTKVSQQSGLGVNKITIRGQKTRWGSCSSKKNISLNYKLLFLPPALVHYVFIHELCHTQHLNHSNKFWTLVKTHDPEFKCKDDKLLNANQYVPMWAY